MDILNQAIIDADKTWQSAMRGYKSIIPDMKLSGTKEKVTLKSLFINWFKSIDHRVSNSIRRDDEWGILIKRIKSPWRKAGLIVLRVVDYIAITLRDSGLALFELCMIPMYYAIGKLGEE